jgi:hypothetical protein
MSEIDRIIEERQARQALDMIPSPREMAHRIAALQEEISAIQPGGSPDLADITNKLHDLDARLQRLEQFVSTSTPAATPTPARPARTSAERASAPAATMPPGAISARDFALQYGVNPRTFIDHIVKGKYGERAPVVSVPKQGRPGESDRYILPEQREQVLEYWRRHGVTFTPPEASEGDEN